VAEIRAEGERRRREGAGVVSRTLDRGETLTAIAELADVNSARFARCEIGGRTTGRVTARTIRDERDKRFAVQRGSAVSVGVVNETTRDSRVRHHEGPWRRPRYAIFRRCCGVAVTRQVAEDGPLHGLPQRPIRRRFCGNGFWRLQESAQRCGAR
jgi:hypothetical protein